jgi:large subunit ribosomal protein L6
MSRIGRQPITIPEDVKVVLEDKLVVTSGPKGDLTQIIRPEIEVKVKNNMVEVMRESEEKKVKALHGLTRTLIANMIIGVSKGWAKELELHGVGYRARVEGDKLILNLGFSHPVEMIPPGGIKISVVKNKIIVSGIDKVLVGQVAANIRSLKKPEPYKGKGIRYVGEKVRRKPGKAAQVGIGGPPGGK